MNRRPASDRTGLWVTAGVVVVLVVVVPWLGWATAAHLDASVPEPGGVADLAASLRSYGWPPAATIWSAVYLTLIAVTVTCAAFVVAARRRGRGPLADRVAHFPADRVGLTRYTTATGPRIGTVIGRTGGVGPTISATLEDVVTVVAGPRTGKTSSLAIPHGLAHRGPLLATSNKPDLVEHLTATRARLGQVWLFDPQGLAGTRGAGWWWNPLETAATVTGARRLAGILTHATRAPGARTDAYFDTAGEELLAQLLLAAAHHPAHSITLTYRWLATPDDPTPHEVLARVPGFEAMAVGLAGNQTLPDKQRAGVYATAGRAVAWLADPDIAQWVHDPHHRRPCWTAASLAASTDTLLSLSREGDGSAAPWSPR